MVILKAGLGESKRLQIYFEITVYLSAFACSHATEKGEL